MNTTFSQRLTAVSFALVLTLGMLAGVNGLATPDATQPGVWAQQHSPQPAQASLTVARDGAAV